MKLYLFGLLLISSCIYKLKSSENTVYLKKLNSAYGVVTSTFEYKNKWTVLELYTDSTFMFAGDLSEFSNNRIFCLKGFYRKDSNLIKLRETYRSLNHDRITPTNAAQYNQMDKPLNSSQFERLWDLYIFAPVDSFFVINLYADTKNRYKITQIYGSKASQTRSGYVNMRSGHLVDSVVSVRDFFLEPVKLEKSIFNCECPTENLFLAYKKLFPKDAEARENQRIGSKPAPKN